MGVDLMGKRYIPHSDMCGCERCAAEWDTESPRQVFDVVEDPDVCDYCGGEDGRCYCADDPDDYEEED
jgi:hypothetical protein